MEKVAANLFQLRGCDVKRNVDGSDKERLTFSNRKRNLLIGLTLK